MLWSKSKIYNNDSGYTHFIDFLENYEHDKNI